MGLQVRQGSGDRNAGNKVCDSGREGELLVSRCKEQKQKERDTQSRGDKLGVAGKYRGGWKGGLGTQTC